MKEAPKGTPSSPQHISQPRGSRPVWKRFLPLAVLAPVIMLSYVVIQSLFMGTPAEPEIKAEGRVRAIQMDVLNGTGETKLAQRMTDYLRAHGFDVVEMGNYKTFDVEQTLVLDRVGNIEAARQVAATLGVPEEQVRQELDKSLYLDITVIIGKDFERLKAFQ